MTASKQTLFTIAIFLSLLLVFSQTVSAQKAKRKSVPVKKASTSKIKPADDAPVQETVNPEPESESKVTATLQETMDWIGSKLSDEAFFTFFRISGREESSIRNRSYKYDSCKLTLIWNYNNSEFYQLEIPFSDIDPLTVKAYYNNSFQFETTSPKRTILYKFKSSTSSDFTVSKEGSTLELVFKGSDQLTRMQNAFSRAIELCGGKVDPF